MNQILTERRQRHRQSQQRLPLGWLTAMLTASLVTLIGVFAGVEPFAVLLRAAISAVLLGTLVSFGVGVIRTANIKRKVDRQN